MSRVGFVFVLVIYLQEEHPLITGYLCFQAQTRF